MVSACIEIILIILDHQPFEMWKFNKQEIIFFHILKMFTGGNENVFFEPVYK